MRFFRGTAVALVAACLTGGCAGTATTGAPAAGPTSPAGTAPAPPASSSVCPCPRTSPSAAPTPDDYAAWCGDPAAVAPGRPVQHSIRIRTADGVSLAAVEAGSGRRGVLMLPEIGSGGGLCGWLDFASHLAANGFRTLAIDHRCLQESGCGRRTPDELMIDIEAAVARLRADGATFVSIIGASQGASEALIFGAGAPRQVDAVVCLSSDLLTTDLAAAPWPATAPAAARRMTRPVLYVVSDGDQYVSVAATKAMYESTPAQIKRLVTLPSGGGHGWRIVDDLTSATTKEVMLFLAGSG